MSKSTPALRIRFWPLLGALMTLLVVAACSSPAPRGPNAQNIVRDASIEGTSGAFQAGAPTANAAAPTAAVTGPNTIIPGGSAAFTISAPEEFTQLFLWLEGLDGFFTFTLPAGTSQRVVVSLGTDLPQPSYSFRFAVGVGSGAGAAATYDTDVESVGTGDVQVNVSWDTRADVDLYLVEPDGTELYYGNRSSDAGGALDLDSNAACTGDDLRNENITYEDGTPPAGEYTVRVNYWSACTVAATNYVVTINVVGQPVRTFEGTFTGEGVGGGSGAGGVVATFRYP